ncbi:DUF2156 domain-containing protein [Frondihabitans cladoniiphilus]|uniref:DUF2156 domain-containing protein n=1 Tax=Frondihabitans cladoniiphilus TaxID=715785 RepID=A0ABP8VP74_9MICO
MLLLFVVAAFLRGRPGTMQLRPLEGVLSVAATLVLVGATERLIGRRKAVRAYVAVAIVSVVVGIAIRVLVTSTFGSTASPTYRLSGFPLYAPAVGSILVASAFASALWRRRIRLLVLASALVFVLFEGSFGGLVTLVAAVTGLLVGIALRSRGTTRRRAWVRSSQHEARVLASSLVAISAAGPFLAVLSRTPVGPLAPLGALFRNSLPNRSLSRACAGFREHGLSAVHSACTPSRALDGLHTPGTALVGFLPLVVLFLAAFFIRRGRRPAVLVAIVVNVVLGVASGVAAITAPIPTGAAARYGALHVLLSVVSASVPLGVAAFLIVLLPHLARRDAVGGGRPDRPNGRAALTPAGAVLFSGAALVAAYVVAGSVAPEVFVPAVGLDGLIGTGILRLLPVGFIGIRHVGSVPTHGLPRILFENIGWAFWVVAILALVVACRERTRGRASSTERESLDRILKKGVSGNLAFMATWDGNEIWYSPSGRSAVAYRRVGDVAVTCGDPLATEEDAPGVVAEFALWCDDQGLLPVFYSVRAALLPVFQRMAWYDLPVGEETVLRPRTFSMQGKKWQDVRSSMNRASKAGVTALWSTYAELGSATARQIHEISEQWMSDKGLPEMGFTLGGLDELQDCDVALMLAIDDDGRVLAVTSWLPSYRDGRVIGWTLDFMRRRTDSMNGVMEFLIASAALKAQEDDLEFLSLSAAPLASSLGADSTAPVDATDRVLSFLGSALEPAYGFQSLFTFKKKFQPDYEQLIMAYPDPIDLPRIGAALGRAYLPDLTARQIPKLLRSLR